MSYVVAKLAGRQLGRRETQVLQLLAEGHSMPAIAEQLHIALGTAKTFSGMLFAKLGARTAAQAVAIGYQRGHLAVAPELAESIALIRNAQELGYRVALVADLEVPQL